MSALVVNLLAGPGAGKSTMAAEIFAGFKWRGVNAELITEFAKELVWEDRLSALANQLYVFGEQYQRLYRLADKVDVIVTDSPLILSSIYKPPHLGKEFDSLVLNTFNSFSNVNYFLNRTKPYCEAGRLQTEKQASEKDCEILQYLETNRIPYSIIPGDRRHGGLIVQQLYDRKAWNGEDTL